MLKRQQKSVVVYWLGGENVFAASTRPRFTAAYRDVCPGGVMEPCERILSMRKDLAANGYRVAIVNQQTAETIERWW